MSSYASFALKTDGTIWSWGSNSNGALGLNIATTIKRSSPVQIGAATNWSAIASKNYRGAALQTAPTVNPS
jgi:alpha-tubulin suppressor-like RCC1 family protein